MAEGGSLREGGRYEGAVNSVFEKYYIQNASMKETQAGTSRRRRGRTRTIGIFKHTRTLLISNKGRYSVSGIGCA